MFFHDTLALLERGHIRYLVVGGVAVVLHGVVRATADLDLMVDLESSNLKAFLLLVKEAGYHPRVPVKLEDFADAAKRSSWIKEKNMKVFSLFHPGRPGELIDIFPEPPIEFDQAYARRSRVPLGPFEVSIAAIEDLLALKRIAGRPQDLEDIKALENLGGGGS